LRASSATCTLNSILASRVSCGKCKLITVTSPRSASKVLCAPSSCRRWGRWGLKGIEVELAEGWLTNAPWGLERSHAESVYNVATNAAGNLASLPLPPLVDLLGRGTEDAKCAAARAIKNLAPDSRAAIAQAGAIPPLVGLLQSGSASVTEQAVSAVHNLTIGSEQVCLAIAQAGAIPPLVGLLQSGSASVAEQAVSAIGNLASGSEPRKAAIAQAGAIPPLVGLLQSGSASVAEKAVSAIRNLASGSEQIRLAIAQAGAIPPLVGLLQSGSASVAEQAVSAIRNLTSGSEPRRAVIAQAGAIPPLVGLLQSGSASVAEQALRVIRKLAADSETRKAAIAEAAHCAGAIPLLGGLLYAEEEEEGVEAGETSSRPTTNDPIKVLRGEHEGRYARISTDRQGSKPYKVRFYDGLVSGWLAERDVEKVSEQEKTHEQSREKGAAGEDDGKGRTAGPAVASLGVTPSYWVGKYAGQHGFALFHINPNSSLRLWSALEKIMCVPDPHNLGVGQDASGGDYTQLELRRAWRVEHPANWMQYTAAKVEVQSQMQRCNTSRLRSLKTALQKAYAAVPEMACDAGINEVFLLHGTKPEILYDVLSNGLVEGFSGGLFGQGQLPRRKPLQERPVRRG